MHKNKRLATLIALLLLTLVAGSVSLSTISPVHSVIVDQYFVYSRFDPPGIGDVVAAGGYVEDYGVPGTWGDEIQYVYFLSGNTGYKVKVWVTNNGSIHDPTPYIDIRQHPDHYDPNHIGPIEPRQFLIVSSKDLSGYTSGSGYHREEFHVDSSGVYLGAYPNGIHKWDHDWNYIGKVANSPPTRTESMAYNPAENLWYAGGRYRTIYQLNDTNNDGSFLDESWVAIFTYPDYGGNHHDGMEYLNPYLWISDMTSDVIGKWQYNSTTHTWEELKRFTYTEVGYVEGMGFGPNDHFWCGSGWGTNEYVYELGNEITWGYPIASAGPDFDAYPPTIPVEFDASGSHHTDPTKEIVLYEWDFESDGIWDYYGTDPVVEHAYPAYYNPDSSINWTATAKNYTATLRVTDNSIPPLSALDTSIVHITAPPWKPLADPDGPYNTRICHPIQLDGSKSYDPESLMYSPGHPWYENISRYEWDLDNDGEFDDSTDMKPVCHWPANGTYFVGLRVTDSQPSGPGGTIGPLDIDEKYTVVIVSAIHDVAVVGITPSTTEALIGEAVTIEVAVSNLGDFNETFSISTYCDGEAIGTATVLDLPPSHNSTLNFNWDTTNATICQYYTIKAVAAIVPGEIIVDNNVLESDKKVHVMRAPRMLKERALTELESALTLDLGDDDLIQAIDYLHMSLGDDRGKELGSEVIWIDDWHVDEIKGVDTFQYEEEDSDKLDAYILNDENIDTGVAPIIDSVREKLYKADKLLAEKAIEEAEAAGGVPADIEKAKELYQQAVDTYVAGIYAHTSPKLSDVMDLFEEAWEKAVGSY